MYTAEEVDALRARLEREGARGPEIVKRMAWACVGWPYVFGALGEMCDPKTRRKYMGYHPEHAANIRGACPVLSGTKADCAGCQWERARCFDCRGFTRRMLAHAGLDLYGGGATTQWETAGNWAAKGSIDTLPAGLVCCVFKRKEGKMSHTGLHVGDGQIVHCSTTVKPDALPGRPAWTHWAVPAGLYSNQELKEAGIAVESAKNTPTLRRGATGELVKRLQTLLNQTGAELDVDGIFGGKTEEAVLHFQGLHDLTDDGIVGPKTWAALEAATNHIADAGNMIHEPDEPSEPEPPGIWISLDDWRAIKAAAATLLAALKKYE